MSQATELSPAFLSRQWKPYPSYKPSGVDWLDEIPKHWGIMRLKFGYEACLGKMLTSVPSSPEDTLEPYLRSANILWGNVDISDIKEMYFSSYEKEIYSLKPGDLVVSEGGDVGRAAIWNGEIENCYIQNAVHRIRGKKGFLNKFLYYWLFFLKAAGYIDLLCSKATIAHLTLDKLRELPIYNPPIEEQKQIARFLDRETTRIDTLITKKRQLIALLQRKRDAIIYEAVTKGIDEQLLISQGVGFDWCWYVPKEWDVVRLKFIAGVQTGLTLGKDYKNRAVVSRPYLRVANVQDGFLDLSEITEIEIPPEDISRYELKPGDVLMTEGGDFDKLGRGYVWEGQIEGCLHQNHVFAVRPHMNYLDSHYLSAIMTSYYGKAYFTSTSQQTTNLATTNSTKLGDFPLPLPSINQQDEILKELDSKLSKLFLVIDKLDEQIGYMQKHKSSLITAAVTGKIDVRKEVN